MTTTKKTTKKESEDHRGRKPNIPNEAKITLLKKENPRRPGTKAYKRFALYKSGMTVGEYLKKGGTRGALKKDASKGRIKILTSHEAA